MDVEKELLQAKEQCIQLTEEINKTEADVSLFLHLELVLLNVLFAFFSQLLVTKHSKESVENSRNEDVTQLQIKYEKRESQLIAGVEALQARYSKNNQFTSWIIKVLN